MDSLTRAASSMGDRVYTTRERRAFGASLARGGRTSGPAPVLTFTARLLAPYRQGDLPSRSPPSSGSSATNYQDAHGFYWTAVRTLHNLRVPAAAYFASRFSRTGANGRAPARFTLATSVFMGARSLLDPGDPVLAACPDLAAAWAQMTDSDSANTTWGLQLLDAELRYEAADGHASRPRLYAYPFLRGGGRGRRGEEEEAEEEDDQASPYALTSTGASPPAYIDVMDRGLRGALTVMASGDRSGRRAPALSNAMYRWAAAPPANGCVLAWLMANYALPWTARQVFLRSRYAGSTQSDGAAGVVELPPSSLLYTETPPPALAFYALTEFTPRGLWKWWYPTSPGPPPDAYAVSLGQLVHLFAYLRTKLVVLGPGGELVGGVQPGGAGGRSVFRVGCVLVAHGHLFPLLDQERVLGHGLGAPERLRELGALLGGLAGDPQADARVLARPLRPPSSAVRTDAPSPPTYLENMGALLTTPLGSRGADARSGSSDCALDAFVVDVDFRRLAFELVLRGVMPGLVWAPGGAGGSPAPTPNAGGELLGLSFRVRLGVHTGELSLSTTAAMRRRPPTTATARPPAKRGRRGGRGGGGVNAQGPVRPPEPPPAYTLLRISAPPRPWGEGGPPVITAPEYAALVTHKSALQAALLTPRGLSSYSPSLRAALEAATTAGIVAGSARPTPDGVVTLDGCRMYTSCSLACASRGWPRFGPFDALEPADPSAPLIPSALYLVRAREGTYPVAELSPLFMLLPALPALVFGRTLALAAADPDYDARDLIASHVCVPSGSADGGPWLAAAKAVLAPDCVLSPDRERNEAMKKWMFNTLWGVAARLTAQAADATAFTLYSEATAWAGLHGGEGNAPFPLFPPPGAPPGDDSDGATRDAALLASLPPLYIVARTASTPLHNGWRVLALAVWEEAHCRLYKVARKAAARGRDVLGVRTDSVVLARLPSDVEIPKRADWDALARPDGYFSATFGPAPPPPPSRDTDYARRLARERADVVTRLPSLLPQPPTLVRLTDEWSVEEAAALLLHDDVAAGVRVLVQASCPGAGKTTLLRRVGAHACLRQIVVAPYNALCLEAVEAVDGAPSPTVLTPQKLMGLRVASDEEDRDDGPRRAVQYLDPDEGPLQLILDEVALYTNPLLSVLANYLKERQAAYARAGVPLYVHATADVRQLPPIQQLHPTGSQAGAAEAANPAIGQRRTAKALASIFSTHLWLAHNKRQDGDGAAAIQSALELMWGPPPASPPGFDFPEWTPARQSALVRSPLLRRRTADLARVVAAGGDAGVRVICYHRAVAANFGAALHAASPSLASGEKYTGVRPPPPFFPGLLLRCCARLEITHKGVSCVLIPNFEYTVTAVGATPGLTQLDSLDLVPGPRTPATWTSVRLSAKQVAEHLAYTRSATTHSLQGATVRGAAESGSPAVLIVELNYMKRDRGLLTTALTRPRDVDNMWVWTGPLDRASLLRAVTARPPPPSTYESEEETEFEEAGGDEPGEEEEDEETVGSGALWINLLEAYARQDAVAGRPPPPPEDALDVRDFRAWASAGLCHWCGTGLTPTGACRLTADRLQNALPHSRSNCVPACLRCNVTKVAGAVDVYN